jgi:phosphoribosyl 1,2-cyclic phosphodiesterase
MYVRFWGTRGSIPSPLTAQAVRDKVVQALMEARGKELRSAGQIRTFVEESLPFHITGTYGGNTPCVEIESLEENESVLCDGGSGLREFGKAFFAGPNAGQPHVFHIFMSHMHYDHMQGIPFFGPGYVPNNKLVFHGCHDSIEKSIREQMTTPYFPVTFDELKSTVSFEVHKPGDKISVAGLEVSFIEQDHPGVSYGYRFQRKDKSVVYSTDAEHRAQHHCKDYPFLDFIRDADLLIFDAPYTFSEVGGAKEDWGHSSNLTGVDFASRARVKHLAIFHHDPAGSDKALYDFHRETKNFLLRRKDTYRRPFTNPPVLPSRVQSNQLDERYPSAISLSYDGLIIEI